MRYKILGEWVLSFAEFSYVLSSDDVLEEALLAELDRLYAEWKNEGDFYVFIEEECNGKLEELTTASDEAEFFLRLLGASHRSVAPLSAREKTRRAEEHRKTLEAKKREEERRKAEEAKRAEEQERIPRSVQLWKNGSYWADRNVGAEKPEDYGYYFWWGDTIGYKREDDKWVASNGSSRNFEFKEGNTPTYDKYKSKLKSEGWINDDGVLVPKRDAAQAHWGDEWRIPTKDELEKLSNECDWEWTTVNGISGYVFRGRGNYASSSIFLPAAGHGYGTSLYSAGSGGYYWSSVLYSDYRNAWDLYFNLGYHCAYDNYRYYGHPVRAVQGL